MIYKDEMISVDGITTLTTATIALAKVDRENVGACGGIKRVICTVESASIRIRSDGGDPTNSVGHLLSVGDVFIVNAEDVANFKAIKVDSVGKFAASYEV